MAGWEQKRGGFTSNAYTFLRPQSPAVNWEKIVWEQWALPRHNFTLWLAMLEKLRTKDRLKFIRIDTLCMFCRQAEESHAHLFFGCTWTISLWSQVKSWLKLSRRMSTFTSAMRGLPCKRKTLVARMWRASLCILVYLIWEERNKRIFYDKSTSPALLFRKFQIIFYMILHFHEKDHTLINVAWWFLRWKSPMPGWAICGCLMLRVLGLLWSFIFLIGEGVGYFSWIPRKLKFSLGWLLFFYMAHACGLRNTH
jgi:hypothetical protein